MKVGVVFGLFILAVMLRCIHGDEYAVGPVESTVEHACEWFIERTSGKTIYRCCDGFFLSARECIQCPSGTFGHGCVSNCNTQCNGHVNVCDPVDGTCDCTGSEYFGETCGYDCTVNSCQYPSPYYNHGVCNYENTRYYLVHCESKCQCGENEYCDISDGSCQCIHNYWGDDCESECIPSCENYEECDKGNCQCPYGKYGDECELQCSTCYNLYGTDKDIKCNRTTGSCICHKGWTGYDCTDCDETVPYDETSYFCDSRCLHCYHDVCSHGSCDCTAGWKGSRCQERCDVDHYGEDCQYECQCNEFEICDFKTGDCNQCNAGYKGDECRMPCEVGKYGYDCKLSCKDNCVKDECHHITGDCTPCPTGYHGDKCDIQCLAGYYERNCQMQCNQCSGHGTCHHETGCVCEPGWTGVYCEMVVQVTLSITTTSAGVISTGKGYGGNQDTIVGDDDEDDEEQSLLPIIVAIVIVTIVIIAIIVVTLIICQRRKNNHKRNADYDDIQTATQRTVTMEMTAGKGDFYSDLGDPEETSRPLNLPVPDVRIDRPDARNRHNYQDIDECTVLPNSEHITPDGKCSTQGRERSTQGRECSTPREPRKKPNNPSHHATGQNVDYAVLEDPNDKPDILEHRPHTDNEDTAPQHSSHVDHSIRDEGEQGGVLGGADSKSAYNVVDRTGKTYRQPRNEESDYNTLNLNDGCHGNDDDDEYNRLDFTPKRVGPPSTSDYTMIST
ncbi:uncharacterized protein LOC144450185 [Glandiceps talaboti]